MWKKVILAVAVLVVVCGMFASFLHLRFVFRHSFKLKEIGDWAIAENDWSESVLTPKSGNPKVFFDKFSFEHGLFHSVNGEHFVSPKRIGTISTKVWNESNSTISELWFAFTLIDTKTKSEIFQQNMLEMMKVPPDSTRGVKINFVMPVETFEGIEDWEQVLRLYEVKRESKYSEWANEEFVPIPL